MRESSALRMPSDARYHVARARSSDVVAGITR